MVRDEDARGTGTWMTVLASATVVGTLAASCMMPLVALAVVAAATMSRSRSAMTVATAWATNQILGFILLGYPPVAFTIAWGLALGLASLLATVVAAAVLDGRPPAPVRVLVAFASAFAAYEGGLFAFALLAGGTETFTARIVLRILANEACWCAGLFAAYLLLRRAAPSTFAPRTALRTA